jgi:hypothetical protein
VIVLLVFEIYSTTFEKVKLYRSWRSGMDDELWTPEETAAYLKVSEQTLANWRSAGRGPAYTRAEGGVRYWLSGVRLYLEERTVQPVNE